MGALPTGRRRLPRSREECARALEAASHPLARYAHAFKLAELHGEAAIPALLASLSRPSQDAVAWALGRLGRACLAEALDCYRRGSDRVKHGVLALAQRLADHLTPAAYVRLLDSPEPAVRAMLPRVLRLRQQGLDDLDLTLALSDPDPFVRRAFWLLLAEMGRFAPEVLPAWLELEDAAERIRPCIQAVIPVLFHHDPHLRRAAIEALSLVQADEARPALEALREDPDLGERARLALEGRVSDRGPE
ncbi:MAG: HEAT repeat domain-containing protein, partial [Candidatus Eremiobacterota bacterium]